MMPEQNKREIKLNYKNNEVVFELTVADNGQDVLVTPKDADVAHVAPLSILNLAQEFNRPPDSALKKMLEPLVQEHNFTHKPIEPAKNSFETIVNLFNMAFSALKKAFRIDIAPFPKSEEVETKLSAKQEELVKTAPSTLEPERSRPNAGVDADKAAAAKLCEREKLLRNAIRQNPAAVKAAQAAFKEVPGDKRTLVERYQASHKAGEDVLNKIKAKETADVFKEYDEAFKQAASKASSAQEPKRAESPHGVTEVNDKAEETKEDDYPSWYKPS